ncbi:MAG: hypothetical protein ACK5LP_00460 [Campylobacteraceae bacterium]
MRSQKILDTLPNGWIKISYKVTNIDILIMFMRRCFPDMVVISPIEAKEKFQNYLNKSLCNIYEVDKIT